MKNKILMGLTTLGLITLLFTSCSKVPQVEIDQANALIEEAKIAGADIYEHDQFVALQDSMKSAMTEVETQKSKFIKNYSSAKKQLDVINNLALNVKQETLIKIEELKVKVQKSIVDVNTLIETNKQLLLEAPKGKEGTLALNAIKGELTAIETSVEEVKVLVNEEDYLNALNAINAAKEKATSINTELNDVINKYKARAKKN